MTSPVLLAAGDEGDLLAEMISVSCVTHARARATTSASVSTWINQVRHQTWVWYKNA